MTDTGFDGISRKDEYSLAMRTLAGDNSHMQRRLRRTVSAVVDRELTEKQRAAVRMYYFEGMSVSEIAQELGVSRSTVYRNMARGMKRIERSMRYTVGQEE